ncbi:PREDICTED: ATP-sensitive inward rectifier potassium channel 8 isoform X4 [Papilio xuthus]|uniref:ATP-sensitive inward rectifier potassium channel 8 isoform X4 n=1 Tax=Papilio xuthus TaxID=66420 RepID=A0AAJ6ZBV8_PAPXU|nr:PREDICTED: ATP-sensitive inward rectifier potassium channel 8 isoform X4 [Papilio xuthus]
MSDKTSSSVGPRSFETISEEDVESPWEKLLGEMKTAVPTIIKTNASSATICKDDVSVNPQIVDIESNKLTRSKSLNQRRNSSGLLSTIPRQLRLSLRGVRSEPSSVKDVPTTRNDSSLNLFLKYRQARYAARRVRKRVIFKHGDCNVVQWNVAKRRRRYLQDIFTTLVDAQWRWTLLVFALSFILSWLLFALIWWLIIFTHGDLNPPTPNSTSEFIPCLNNVNSFTGCFLFSVETQHTIGYGSRTTNEECPEAIFVMCLQSIVGVFIQAFMMTREGEVLPFYQQELKVGADGEEDRLMFIWPMTIVHKINEKSPLYNLSASDMLRERFEIVVMLEGVIESTGMTTQARSSFLPSEILWGHRFETMVSFRKDTGEYEVDYTRFNNTYEVDTPLCSAKQLDELRATVSTSQKLDRMLGTIPKTFSNDTLDLSSVDSISLDEHIEIKIPEARVRENRLMAQNNFVQHVNEKLKNHSHLVVENGQVPLPKNPSMIGMNIEIKADNVQTKDGHIQRCHSHASMKRAHGLTPNGVGHHGPEKDHKIKKSPSDNHIVEKIPVHPIPILVTSPAPEPA